MDKTIVFYNELCNRIIYLKRRYYYELYSGRIHWSFNINTLLSDDIYLKDVLDNLKFDKYEILYAYKNIRKQLFIPVSKNLIEYYSIKDENVHEESIELSNTTLCNNVDSFYQLSLEIVIGNFRSTFERSFAFKNMIYIKIPQDENVKSQMTQLFGDPRNIPELENEQYGSGKMYFYYIVPISRIDKIIGIKRYRDISTFGQKDGEQFTGEIEEIVLDLHKFDEHIYQIFKEHGMLEIE